MIQSRPIEVDGRFVGVAVHASLDWHFIATDPLMDDLHGQHFANAEDAARVATLVYRRATARRLAA
jgi:hypothetical protein